MEQGENTSKLFYLSLIRRAKYGNIAEQLLDPFSRLGFDIRFFAFFMITSILSHRHVCTWPLCHRGDRLRKHSRVDRSNDKGELSISRLTTAPTNAKLEK